MSGKDFLKDKLLSIFCMFGSVVCASFLFLGMGIGVYAVVFLCALFVLPWSAGLLAEFLQKRSFYNAVKKNLDQLDQKYLLCEMTEEPSFSEGHALVEILTMCNKSMNDEIAVYRRQWQEYREYIETWVHEVKTPIASTRLILENNRNPVTVSAAEEILKIEGFVDQALFYARSNSVEKDYTVKRMTLRALVNSALKKDSRILIEAHVALELSDLEQIVYTDGKWIDFILGQIFSNSVKYRGSDPKLCIYGEAHPNSVSLVIADNGIGILAQDLPRVFEKGFTGKNGRGSAKSTGLGLYLCQKLCKKLGLGLRIASKEGEGTVVELLFPISSMYQ